MLCRIWLPEDCFCLRCQRKLISIWEKCPHCCWGSWPRQAADRLMLGPGLIRCAGWRVDILLGSQEGGVLEGRGHAQREEATRGKASLPSLQNCPFSFNLPPHNPGTETSPDFWNFPGNWVSLPQKRLDMQHKIVIIPIYLWVLRSSSVVGDLG